MIGTPRTIFAIDDAPALTATDTSGANAAITLPITSQKFKIQEVGAIITTAVTVANAVITVARIKGQGVTAVDIGSFTLPFSGSTIGDVIKASFASFGDTDLAAGEWLRFTSDGGGDAGGAWFFAYGYEIEANPQAVVNFGEVAKDPAGTGNILYAAATEI
jgi:hypothetical protein